MSEQDMVGGLSDLVDADDKTQELCDSVKACAEIQAGETYEVFTAKSYRSQLVAGTNYYIKVHVGEDNYVHLHVFEALSGDIGLHGMQHPKTEYAEIEPF